MKIKCNKTPTGWAATQFNLETGEEEVYNLTEEQTSQLDTLYEDKMSSKTVHTLIDFNVFRVTGFSPLVYREGINICNYRPTETTQEQYRF